MVASVRFCLLVGAALSIAIAPSPANPQGSPRLVIAPLVQIEIKNADDVEDDLGSGEPSQVFARFLHSTLPDQLVNAAGGSLSAVVSEASYSSGFETEKRELREPRGTFRRDKRVSMRLPKEGTVVRFKGASGDLVLFLENFRVRRGHEGSADGAPATTLEYTSDFAVWDNGTRKVRCFGKAEGANSIRTKMQRETWVKAMQAFAESVVRECPIAP